MRPSIRPLGYTPNRIRDGMRMAMGSEALFSPRQLFLRGENGAWYEPRDTASMLQDATGFTPVTEAEQPVGLLLDKRLNGIGTNGAARYNLLQYTGAFDTAAYWHTASNVTILANQTTAPDGTNTADLMTEAATTATHRVTANNNSFVTTDVSSNFILSCSYKPNAGSPWALLIIVDSGGSNQARAWFNINTGELGSTQTAGSGVVVSSSIEPAANGFYRCTLTGRPVAGTGVIAFVGMANANLSLSYAGNTGRSVFIWGADFRLASNANAAPAYQPIPVTTWQATIAGNHATQSTLTARPTTKNNPARLFFDADPDSLTINFASSPGVSTVAYGVSGGDPVINTGVNISGTTYTLNPTNTGSNLTGLVIVNRALTTAETANLTAYLRRLS